MNTSGAVDEHGSGNTLPFRVLVIESDANAREELARALEAAGHEVMVCPGPSAPDYTCVAIRGSSCALAAGADAVVLDTRLQGDDRFGGTTGWQLALHYSDQGLPVLALAESGGATSLLRGKDVVTLPRGSPAHIVIQALGRLVRESGTAS